MNSHWMALMLLSLHGGHAWVSSFVSKATSPSALRFHTRSALRFRCGGHNKASWGKLVFPVPLWATSSCLYQSTAAAEPTSEKLNIERKTEKTRILAHEKDFVKPDPDLRQYRWIKLPNNLQVLLVSTTETTSKDAVEEGDDEDLSHVEAAAVHVQAGHFDDTIPGLAHFHEHMLFLGTEKYPQENEYEAFLSKYGGFSNAYTDMEDTNYYFSLTTTTSPSGDTCDTTSEALEGSLDRLAQFFISPTFESNMVDREIKAIDSEWRNSRTSDQWRNYQLLKASANQAHPFANFGCGNAITLTANNTASPRPALLEFWKKYYQTYNLRLAVVGYAPLDALQESVERTFGSLPYSEGRHRRIPEKIDDTKMFPYENAQYQDAPPAFGPEQVGFYRQVIPVMETRSLKLYFPAPPVDDPSVLLSKPHRIISHLLGHESPGSLHALLNDLGYIQNLSSGMGIVTSDFALFSLAMSLTPKGMANKDHVLDLAFQWINLISNAILDPQNSSRMEQYHQELRQIFMNNFKFRENGDPTDFCSTVAELMFDPAVPPERILISDNDKGIYDPDITKAFLERLKPSNCLIMELNSDLVKERESAESSELWETEPLYGAQYRTHQLTTDQLKAWSSREVIDDRLKLPGLNEYIPTDFSLRCDDDVQLKGSYATTNGDIVKPVLSESERNIPPTKIWERDGLRLWHKMDKYWRVPKAFIRLSLVSPNLYRSPRTMTYNRIYQRILNDDLKSTVYDASLAGCNYRVACTPTGIRVSVRGYNEKLSYLLNTLTTRMLSLIEEMKQGPEAYPALNEKFEKAKENLLRETKNYRLDTPYEVASYNSRLILEERVWYLNDYVNEMEGDYAERNPLTMAECAQIAEECLTGRHKAEVLAMGNIDENGALEACKVIENHFFSQKISRPLSEAELPTFRSLRLPTQEEATHIFGVDVLADGTRKVPLVFQELAYSPSEENNAIEYIIQTGSELELEYEGLAMLELIGHVSYNSAFNQLRTKEQLGYIVSTFARKTTGGGWGLSVVVQSSNSVPEVLEERVEAWLELFRAELEDMPAEDLAMEAAAVVSQLKERDTKLSQEVTNFWGEIVNTETYSNRLQQPSFDRLDRLADELVITDGSKKIPPKTMNGNTRKTPEEMKQRLLDFIDRYISAKSPARRAMSSRVYSHSSKDIYESNLDKPGILSTFEDIRHVKQFLSSWPLAPYWRKQEQS